MSTIVLFKGMGSNPIYDLKKLYEQYSQLWVWDRFQQLYNSFQVKNTKWFYDFNIRDFCSNNYPSEKNITDYTYLCIVLRFVSQYIHIYLNNKECEGTIGHSNGIVASLVQALHDKNDIESVFDLFVNYLLNQGYYQMENSDYEFNGKYNMLQINNTSINEVNELIKKSKSISIACENLYNEITVTGYSTEIYELKCYIDSISNNKKGNENKIVFSKRSKQITCNYLPIPVIVHNVNMNKNVVSKLLELKKIADHPFFSKTSKCPIYDPTTGSEVKNNYYEWMVKSIHNNTIKWSESLSKIMNNYKYMIEYENSKGFMKMTQQAYPYCSLIKDNSFVTKFNMPPLLIAGMTPCTGNEDIIVSALKHNYYIELAGGAQHTPDIFQKTISNISKQTSNSIFINMLYANARLWNFQFPLALQMKKQGHNIQGITIAAGVPSIENAKDIIEKMTEVGITTLSLKPSSTETIIQCCELAEFYKNFTFVIQWTGGRGGGHHSYEDFHEPLLNTYLRIRSNSNIYLVVGSGFGSYDSFKSYLDGSWALQYNIHYSMKVDAILFGSYFMAAKECKLSDQGKQLLVNTVGVNDEKDWEKSYDGDVGGVITVTSELGEPIHVINTKGVQVWKEFDEKYFKSNNINLIKQNKQDIISKLNKYYQRIYFGDIEKMTGKEVLHRHSCLCKKMYNSSKPNDNINEDWIHSDYELRYKQLYAFLNHDFILNNFEINKFIQICKIVIMKPLPYIPIINEDLIFFFKKDSLWQCENLDCVADQDIQRTFILQSPVSVKYITSFNKTIHELMSELLSHLPTYTFSKQENIPSIEYKINDKVYSSKISKQDIQQLLSEHKFNFDIETFRTSMHLNKNQDTYGYIASKMWYYLIKNISDFDLNPMGIIHLDSDIIVYDSNVNINDCITEQKIITLNDTTLLTEINFIYNNSCVLVFSCHLKIQNTNISTKINNTKSITWSKKSIQKCNEKCAEWVIPSTNTMYGFISGDINPIHFSEKFAQNNGLKTIITHGMNVFITALSKCYNKTIKKCSVKFMNPTFSNDVLSMICNEKSIENGNNVDSYHVVNQNNDVICSIDVINQSNKNVYVFTGQGSIRQGNNDVYSFKKWGVDFDYILKHNPKKIQIKCLDSETKKFYNTQNNWIEFYHPDGLLSSTQFAQPITLMVELAQFMKAKQNGFISDSCLFSGHSLGEYISLSIFSNVFDYDEVLELVYIRGMIMNQSVTRDVNGHTNYRMAAINPKRDNKTFKDIENIITEINKSESLQVVNYNVENTQYIVAGTIKGLNMLKQQLSNEKSFTLLSGIDIPFHSNLLVKDAPQFELYLDKILHNKNKNIKLDNIQYKYIPNLTGSIFELSKKYLDIMSTKINNVEPRLQNLYNNWDAITDDFKLREMLIILLKYQFCSPVQWIDVQKNFKDYNMFYEFGPSKVLCNMIAQTNKSIKTIFMNDM